MRTINHIRKDIQSLNYEAKRELYEILRKELLREETRSIIKKYQGIAKNVWGDAEQYIEELRNNDRI
jgi:hypothetical protein